MADTHATAPDDLVLVGRIERPHGLRGEVVVQPLTDFGDERFVPGATLLTAAAGRTADGSTDLRIDEVRWHRERPLILFAGVESVEAAEALRGHGLWIAAATRRPLEPGSFYETDLVGCQVETVSGQTVGTVVRVEGSPGASVLAIDGPQGEVLVPLADEICRVIDPAARRIAIDPPAGLLELNAPSATPLRERRLPGRRGGGRPAT